MQAYVIKHILFPLHEKVLRRPTLRALTELERIERLPSEHIQEYQWRKLKALLRHAYQHVPYYRYLFQKLDFHPQDLRDWSDFAKLPFLTKEIIRHNIGSLKAKNLGPKDFIRMNTGGSTGEPLIFYVDRRRVAYDRAAHFRARRWWGVEIGEREVVLWGSPIELSAQDRLKECRDKVFNTKLLSAFRMSEEKMREYAQIIKKYRPKHMFGYASSFYLFSKFLRAHNIDLKDLGLKVIFVTADTLYDYQRAFISETFGCPVANGYGGRDLGFVAHECPLGGMHLTEDIYVEIIRDNKPVQPGELGEIVVTHLDNYAMPFIRYRSGDLAILSDKLCPCGRGSTLLKGIEGRATDFIVTPSGKIMHALSLIYILRDLPDIKAFKVIQKAKDYLVILLVKGPGFSENTEGKIKEEVRKIMEAPININFQYVKEIEPEKSGKYRYVVSEVPIDFLK